MKCMKFLFFFLLVGFLLTGGVYAADTIKIGLMAPLTGAAAADGFSVHSSVKLAVERVNGAGGLLG
ncbi:MAG: ABC transporter substrate-binding protein, partial [Candidatus Omnitrophica bacterium]|nr:ABC transporter substrate-binding protein [Candidatus Omnitrophota bacterium]